jgi:hypothetical protein
MYPIFNNVFQHRSAKRQTFQHLSPIVNGDAKIGNKKMMDLGWGDLGVSQFEIFY